MSPSPMQIAGSVHRSAAARVAAIALMFGAIALLLLAMIHLQGNIQDGVRCYVRGEGLWAKAQKDAVLYLDRYSYSRAEEDYQAFRSAVIVNLGDRQARIALAGDPPDETAAREGFLRGGNHPEDVDALIWFYRRFRAVSYLREAIDIWRRGDEKIDQLIAVGAEMHAAILSGNADPERMTALRARIEQLNRALLTLENRFSLVLGDGARWVKTTFWRGSFALLLGFLALALFVSRQIIRGIISSEEQLRLAATVFGASSEGILITDRALAIVSANQALCDMMGWSAQALKGQTPKVFRSGHTSSEQYHEMWAALESQGCWQGDLVDRTRDGALLPVRISISGVRDRRGEITHYVAIISDISERQAREDRLQFLAHHDPLTGLPNRVLFDDRIEQAVRNAHRNDRRFAVLFLDLDDFKPVNDSYGHETGDLLLKQVAERLARNVRSTDTVTRRGGDEFAMLLVDTASRADAEALLAEIVAAVCAPYAIGGRTIRIGVSAGMSLFPDDGSDPAALMHHADLVMYENKAFHKRRDSAS